MGAVTYPTLEHVAMEARPYPAHLLEGCETGLVLFAAAFLGHNDAVHLAEAGMQEVWCIDNDAERLAEMKKLYPAENEHAPYGWCFRVADAWEWADIAYDCDEEFDVVSLDPFTGDTMRRCIEDLELWCSLARTLVVCGITLDLTDSFTAPKGWRSSLFHRANDVYWLVLERA